MSEDQETQERRAEVLGKGVPNDVPARPVSDRTGLITELDSFIGRNPNIFGTADILNVDYLHPHDRAGMLAAVLTGIVTTDHRPAIRKIVVIVPPGTDVPKGHARVWEEILATFRHLAGREMAPEAQNWFKGRFEVIAAPDRRSQSVLNIIAGQPERAAIIITDAASYRDQKVDPYVAPGAPGPLLPQDVWVPQLHALAAAAIEIARERMFYVALDTNQLSPNREALAALLVSIDGCAVMGSSNDRDVEALLAARVDRWDAWIREGRVGQALREIEELPPALTGQKAYLRIQMLHRAGLIPLALQAIREEISPGRKLDTWMRVKLARIAQDANASRLAIEMLIPAVDDLDDLEYLESSLATARDTGSADLEEKVAARLAILFPDSPGVRERKRRALLEARDYAGLAAMFVAEPEGKASAEFYNKLAEYLSGVETPDYHALIACAKGDIARAEAFRMACVTDALRRKLIFHAFDLALPLPKTSAQAERGERLLLQVLEAVLLLAGKGGTLAVESERLQTAVLALIGRLAATPTNQMLRVGLASLVQPSVAGTGGLALLTSVVLKLASRPISLQKRNAPGTVHMDWLLERKTFLNQALDWLKQQEPVVVGRVTLPDSLLTEPADEVVSGVTDYLSNAPIASEDDATSLQFWLAFGAAVTPHSTDPDFDLRLMRLVGGRLAVSGYPQLARDLAEQAVLNCAASARRRRLGWFTMADVYLRCHNYLEGLIALACALAADDVGDEEQVWQEINAISRFLRDCGLHAQARATIGRSLELLETMGLSDTYRHRLETLELQIRQWALSASGWNDIELESLLADAVKNGSAVLEHHDLTEPAAALLGQLLRSAKERGLKIPPAADSVFAELRKHARGSLASLLATISEESVSASELLDLVRMGGASRYSDDVGYDMRNVAIVAGRALADDQYIADGVSTSFALELLADRGVAVPGWDEAAEPPPAPSRVEEPAEIACSLSSEGLSVVQGGFDANGRLVRISAVGGQLQAPVREPDELIHEERFKTWAVDYPYAYGIDESTPNLFYTTTADLRLSALPDGPVVIAADATLQPFPPNLFYVGDDFAGRTRPMAAVPSLAWLKAARAKGRIGDGRLCAWISMAGGGPERGETLPMIAQRLEPTFDGYGFIVDNGPDLPGAFAGATMAVITAHGSVHPEGRYFQVVSDEGVLRVAASDLAGALRNVDTVILFVCSGGRSDKHPGAHTTLGLAKQILDRGCQAVIASPWPLDARVPSHWLPVFLEHWSRGEPLIEANFAANKLVDRNFANDPARGLAMTVFGNPTIRQA